ncbi:MAG: CHAT domain-containing protein, partial [Rhodospirillales bacterium]
SRPSQEQSAARLEATKAAIADLRAARTALLKEIEARFPEYADLMSPKPATVAEARAALRPGEALITAYVGEMRTYVWAITNDGKVSFAVVPVSQRELSIKVAVLRSALQPNARTLGDIPEFDLKEAYGLYKALLEPVAAGWRDAKSLLVVAHGPLGHLPLSLLPTTLTGLGPEREPLFSNYRDAPWLARTHTVTMLPSVASLRTLRRLPPGDDRRLAFAGFGDPLFSDAPSAIVQPTPAAPAAVTVRGLTTTRALPMRLRAAPATDKLASADLSVLPPLPDTSDEVRGIAVAMNADLTKSVFLGKDASEGRVKSMDLSGFKVLAFATHGLVPGDLDGLTQPALALSSPKVAGGSDDGLLTMGEILGLKLDADWVVLSACNTGSGEGAGADAISGLGRAFFYAGTRALLVSNWPVETTSAKSLTTDIFQRQAAEPAVGRAEALRRAMVGLIDGPGHVDAKSGKSNYSYAHPLFWAPFTIVGDGGGATPGS